MRIAASNKTTIEHVSAQQMPVAAAGASTDIDMIAEEKKQFLRALVESNMNVRIMTTHALSNHWDIFQERRLLNMIATARNEGNRLIDAIANYKRAGDHNSAQLNEKSSN